MPDPRTLHMHARRHLYYRSFERLFAVLFWFVVLGPAGALVYRLAALDQARLRLEAPDDEQVLALVHESTEQVRWLVVDAGAITGVDYSAGAALKDLHENLRKHAASLAFAHVNADLKANLDRLGLTELIGENRLFDKLRDCVAAYQWVLAEDRRHV